LLYIDSGSKATNLQKWHENQDIMQPLVFKQSTVTLKNGEFGEILHIQGGPVVVVSAGGLASYKSESAMKDPLGNGRLGYADIPDEVGLEPADGTFVESIRSGFVQLQGGLALLVTPFHATLYASNDDALGGQNPLAQVPLNQIDLL
jgi:hypothetical protein